MWVTAIGDAVTYYRPTGTDRLAQIVLVDPQTGADLSVSAARYWHHVPARCADDPDSVCATSYVQSDTGRWDYLEFRVDSATGASRPATDGRSKNPGQDHAMVGGDLFWNSSDDVLSINRQFDGTQLWAKPVSDLFGATTTTWTSYSYAESDDRSYSILTLTGATSEADGSEFDLATGIVSSAISMSDGATRWIGPGTALGCLGDHSILQWQADGDSGAEHAFRCRYTGTGVRSGLALDGSKFTTRDLSVELERFDPASGAISWTSNLADARTLAADTTNAADEAILDNTHLYVPNSTGGLVIDLQTGQTRAPTDSDILWCTDTREFARPEAYFTDDTKQVTTARRTGVFRPCRLNGTDAPTPSTALPAAVSTGFGGELRIIASRHHLGLSCSTCEHPRVVVEHPGTGRLDHSDSGQHSAVHD